MKYIKLIILMAFLSTAFTGCSYVSDMVEGAITKRSSFGATATYSGGNVTITWDKTDTSGEFAGIEIYRTSDKNDEYASYELVASRHFTTYSSGNLSSGLTKTCTVSANYPTAVSSGDIYFYRVGIIHIGKDSNDVLYNPSSVSDYNAHTSIDSISGYAEVDIP